MRQEAEGARLILVKLYSWYAVQYSFTTERESMLELGNVEEETVRIVLPVLFQTNKRIYWSYNFTRSRLSIEATTHDQKFFFDLGIMMHLTDDNLISQFSLCSRISQSYAVL
ncbi:hypothetical protein RHMOL_Rhmol04G0380700 [Rhododendron molle]|uniref:Uncharacterized protein n=1 Tax=Rhododendron molle TaxID=49168 RepID=A0ACC0PB58_RHOML|nr:hypothetical protein RHMOL_Rhmol04G0380700 [Rhododendron molle]